MSELPEGWTSVELSTLTFPSRPRCTPSDFPELPFIGMEQIEAHSRRLLGTIPSATMRSSAFRFLKGDVLYGRLRPYLNKVYCAGFDGLCSSEFIVLPSSEAFSSQYLHYYLNTEGFVAFANQLNQGDRPRVSFDQIGSHNIPLPPLDEQRRIVAKLGKLLSRVDAAQARLAAIPRILKRFRQSVLTAACSGRLTVDWRENNPHIEDAEYLLNRLVTERKTTYSNAIKEAEANGDRKPRKILPDIKPSINTDNHEVPSTWTVTNLGFLAHVTKLAGFEYTKYMQLRDEGDVPVVRAQNVQMGEFVAENIKYISEDVSNLLERSQLHGREILMVFIGAVGNVCMAPTDRRWHLAPNVAKIDVNGANSKYLLFYLQSPVGFASTVSFAKATAQASLSMETIRQIVILLPPLSEQQEIVRRVEALFKTADALEARYRTAKAHVDKLTQSILARAFRGELVTTEAELARQEGRAYEPASVLLERIRQERAQQATSTQPKPKQRRAARKKAASS